MKIIERITYKFEELTKESQEKALSNYMEHNQESYYDYIQEDLAEAFRTLLEDKGYDSATKSYDESKVYGTVYCAELEEIIKRERELGSKLPLDEMQALVDVGILRINVDNFYGKTESINWWDSVYYAKEMDYSEESLENALNALEELVKKDFESVATSLRKAYYEIQESYLSEESVTEELLALDEMFFEDGKISCI